MLQREVPGHSFFARMDETLLPLWTAVRQELLALGTGHLLVCFSVIEKSQSGDGRFSRTEKNLVAYG